MNAIKVEFLIPHTKLGALQSFIQTECAHVPNQNSPQSASGANQTGEIGGQPEKPAQSSGRPGRPSKAEKEAREKAAEEKAREEKARQESAEKETSAESEAESEGDDSGWGDDESDDDKPLTPDQRSKLMVALKSHSKANSFDETKAVLKKISGTVDPAKVTRKYFAALEKALA